MNNFKVSLTHKSVTEDILTSLEYFEAKGDSVLNCCLKWMLVDLHPEIIRVGYLNNITSAIQGTRFLVKVAVQKGWREMMILNPEIYERLKILADLTSEDTKGDYEIFSQYEHVFEDALEAFFGCLAISMMNDGRTFGAAMEISRNIVTWMFTTTYFEGPNNPPGLTATYLGVTDSATVFRDLYQNANELHWNAEQAFDDGELRGEIRNVVYKGKTLYSYEIPASFQWTIYHWDGVKPMDEKGDVKQYYNKHNRKVLYIGPRSFDKARSKQEACTEAMKLLAEGKYIEYDGNSSKIRNWKDDAQVFDRVLNGEKPFRPKEVIRDLTRSYIMKHPLEFDSQNSHQDWEGFYSTHVLGVIRKRQGARRGDRAEREEETEQEKMCRERAKREKEKQKQKSGAPTSFTQPTFQAKRRFTGSKNI